ncbi:MAG: segregation/condensation protein A [Firmicutes bacterium]|nr:segregation/condensation protein A [Bacillota bacterium]
MGYKVRLDVFEGPFDLLVYLIESARMSIYDIKVSEITSQYISYLEEMQQMNVAVSSEFMVLAAELIDIKSKMLLPRSTDPEANPEAEDPRTNLVARILEYKKFKIASEILREGEIANFRIYEKPQEDISEYTESPDEYLKLDIDQFVNAFNLFLARKKKIEEIKQRYERIERQKISAEHRMQFIQDLFKADPHKKVPFSEIVQDRTDRYDIALSFSSMLEMIKQTKLTAEQKRIYGEIFVGATEHINEKIVAESEPAEGGE